MSKSKKINRHLHSPPVNTSFAIDAPLGTGFRTRGLSRILPPMSTKAIVGVDPPPERRMEDHGPPPEASHCLIPQPEILRQYREFIGDAPERILRVFEADSACIRDVRSHALESRIKDNRRFQWMAYSLITGGYGISVLFACMNKDVLAGIVLTTTIIGTVTGFMKQRPDTPIKQSGNEAPSG